MRRIRKLQKPLLVLAVVVLLGWVAIWFYRGPDRLTQTIWEDAITRAGYEEREPDWVGMHVRTGEHTSRCDWWALQTVNLHNVTQDRAEVLAQSYERDGWDVTRMTSTLSGTFTLFAIKPDRSQRIRAVFAEDPGSGTSIAAAHDPGNCPLLTIDGLNYDEERNPRVDSFPRD